MFKRINYLLCLMFMGILIHSCASDQRQKRQEHFQNWIQNNGKLKILSTTEMINDLVKQIGSDHVDTMTLIQGELDPHSYQLVKGDDEKLSFAQIIFYNGLGLEHGPSLHQYLTHHTKAFSLGDQIAHQEPQLILEVNGQYDPHIWMDISIWSKAIPFIVQTLSLKDPVHAQDYQENGKKLQKEMQVAHQQTKELMHQVKEEKRYLVTSHDAFNYFARAYLSEEGEIESGEWQKRFAAPEGLAPESQLSTTDIKAIIEHLKQHQIHLIFPESNVSRDSIRKIVQAGQEQGLDVQIACCPLYGDAMGPAGSEGDSYLKMILYNARTLCMHMDPELEKSEKEKNQTYSFLTESYNPVDKSND